MGILKKTVKIIISIILIIIIIINTTLVIKAKFEDVDIPDFCGFTPLIVVTGSMEPQIQKGDVIIKNKNEKNDLNVGDIISYWDDDENIIITHRILEIKYQDSEKYFITKGDSNEIADQKYVMPYNVVGKYSIKIPLVGKIALYLGSRIGIVTMIAIIVGLFIIFEIIDRILIYKEFNKKDE